MAPHLNIVPSMFVLLLLFISASKVQSGAIDVVAKFGAKADGKTDLSKPFLDAWKEACASVTPSTIVIPKRTYLLLKVNLEDPNWVRFYSIKNFKMFGGGILDCQGSIASEKNKDPHNRAFRVKLPVNIRFDFVTNALIQDITSKDSKLFHVNVFECKNITLERFKVKAPADSPNTDGIHMGKPDGVNIIGCDIKTGDDCISVGDGTKNLDIKDITCGPGHGISIGSLGKYPNEEPVEGVKVTNCTITNTSNGARIKTWPSESPGIVSDIHFEVIIVNNVSSPILIDQKYCPWSKCKINEESKVKLRNISFKNIRGTFALLEAVKFICSGFLPCQNVELADIDIKHTGAEPATSQCLNVKPITSGKLNPTPCSSLDYSLLTVTA
ncbi:hypothetical protein E1A91_D09G032300v1 [Gossypium mustelinum]|uniref:Pectate lyase superfamily protein domain-containing protein n=1 Tax=Gossypium mustelinum TaxID=34275 RepID=A0A5D2TEY5_GOSMU|nr:hypothetical protein E1A91_D09G032300v1 [Gossypium mustelinum]